MRISVLIPALVVLALAASSVVTNTTVGSRPNSTKPNAADTGTAQLVENAETSVNKMEKENTTEMFTLSTRFIINPSHRTYDIEINDCPSGQSRSMDGSCRDTVFVEDDDDN